MDQQKLNKKVLTYLKGRFGNIKYSYVTLKFIKSEELRSASIENYELAEALKQAYYEIQGQQPDKHP